ncbi:hypothetical protein FKM82_029873 [Ascaphus truei]
MVSLTVFLLLFVFCVPFLPLPLFASQVLICGGLFFRIHFASSVYQTLDSLKKCNSLNCTLTATQVNGNEHVITAALCTSPLTPVFSSQPCSAPLLLVCRHTRPVQTMFRQIGLRRQ